MGRLSLDGMREMLSEDQSLRWHLQYNHYPPVPESMVPVCKRAIAKARRGDWDARCKLPPGCSWKGHKFAPVSAIVEQHHLEGYLE